MKIKVDENLPAEIAERFRREACDAHTIFEERLAGSVDHVVIEVCRNEQRVLITNDLDFSDVRTYPPQDFFGIIVLRLRTQDKRSILNVIEPLVPALLAENIAGKLWIVEEDRIRIRGTDAP